VKHTIKIDTQEIIRADGSPAPSESATIVLGHVVGLEVTEGILKVMLFGQDTAWHIDFGYTDKAGEAYVKVDAALNEYLAWRDDPPPGPQHEVLCDKFDAHGTTYHRGDVIGYDASQSRSWQAYLDDGLIEFVKP
jgi:hypothetical protein